MGLIGLLMFLVVKDWYQRHGCAECGSLPKCTPSSCGFFLPTLKLLFTRHTHVCSCFLGDPVVQEGMGAAEDSRL